METILIIIASFTIVYSAIKPIRLGRARFGIVETSLSFFALFLLFGIIQPVDILQGLLGNGGALQPWKIIVIFFSVAYVSLSTDTTGIFDYFAYKIIHASRGKGRLLFFSIFLFTSILTILTSNDIVILTLTPIIFYLGKHAKVNVLPLLFLQFFAANSASMFFFTGDPTNIIVSNALDLGFWEYTKVMWLPTLVALLTNLGLIWLLFRKDVPKKFEIDKTSHFKIRNWLDVGVSSLLILVMFTLFLTSDHFGIQVWIIALITAGIFILKDILFDIVHRLSNRELTASQKDKHIDTYNLTHKNQTELTVHKMPLKILPFIITFFVFVAALTNLGVINKVAELMSSISQTLAGSIASMGAIGLFLGNIINNQPMTIFLSNVLTSANFITEPLHRLGSSYALVIASDLAANLTLVGALAGLMWVKILKVKGLTISYVDFFKKGILITPIVLATSLFALYIVLKFL